MLACALHDEALPLGVRVQLLSVDMPVCVDATRRARCPQWPTAIDIGRQALALLARRDGAEAVVRCVPMPVEPASVASAPVASAPVTDAMPASSSSQGSDGAVDAPCAGWLQDARALLQSVLSPSSPPPRQESPR